MLAEPPGSDFLKTYARAMMKYSGDMRSPCSTPLPMSNTRDVKALVALLAQPPPRRNHFLSHNFCFELSQQILQQLRPKTENCSFSSSFVQFNNHDRLSDRFRRWWCLRSHLKDSHRSYRAREACHPDPGCQPKVRPASAHSSPTCC